MPKTAMLELQLALFYAQGGISVNLVTIKPVKKQTE